MNKQSHNTLHLLVPVYSALYRIQKFAVDGFVSGKADLFVDIRRECEKGMGDLLTLEQQLVGKDGKRRREYEQTFKR